MENPYKAGAYGHDEFEDIRDAFPDWILEAAREITHPGYGVADYDFDTFYAVARTLRSVFRSYHGVSA